MKVLYRALFAMILLAAPLLITYGITLIHIKMYGPTLPNWLYSPYFIFSLYAFSLPMLFYKPTERKYWLSVISSIIVFAIAISLRYHFLLG